MLSSEARANLHGSGLEDETIEKAQIEDTLAPAGEGPAYKIPYFDLSGNPIDFSRTRLLGGTASYKYKQPAKSLNHVYIPPFLSLHSPGWESDASQPLIITEGEKKALAAAQRGLLCIGLGGVDSWRTHRVAVGADSVISRPTEKRKLAVLEVGDQDLRAVQERVAPELLEIEWEDRDVLIAYDLPDIWANPNVGAAAFRFGTWLAAHGARPHLWEPEVDTVTRKIGLDDYLLEFGATPDLQDFSSYLAPAPHDIKAWLRNLLNQRQTRDIQEQVAYGILTWLDRNGVRYRHGSQPYYFESLTKTLHVFSWDEREKLRGRSFGRLLSHIGLKSSDGQIRERLADDYMNAEPVFEVEPYNTLAVTRDAVYFQIQNGRMLRVTADSIEFLDNGTDDILFVSQETEPLNEDRLEAAIQRTLDNWDTMGLRWWDALTSVYLQPQPPFDLDQTRAILTILFYISPFLQRWRGLQLPIEVAVAEAGSGKTFLYNLRKWVLTGRAKLDHVPNEFRDWQAALAAAPGLWVGDNLGGNTDRQFWNQMNETLARLVTDPDPTIDARELFTTADIRHIHVRSAFAFTAIGSWFNAPDVLQRSIVYKLQAIPEGEKNSGWLDEQMAAGREAWVAEHMVVLHKFLAAVQTEWVPGYRSAHRLRHFEQVLRIMAKLLGFDPDALVDNLAEAVNEEIAADNPLIDALRDFVRDVNDGNWILDQKNGMVALKEICEWAQSDDRHRNFGAFRSSTMLGKRVREMASQLENSIGLQVTNRHNQTWLKLPTRRED